MADRITFRVGTPLSYNVVLTRNRWREIIRFKHPALKGREREVQKCLEAPDVIRASAKDPDVHLYYASSSTGFLCVVVAPADANDEIRFVVTAYFTKRPKQGTELWRK